MKEVSASELNANLAGGILRTDEMPLEPLVVREFIKPEDRDKLLCLCRDKGNPIRLARACLVAGLSYEVGRSARVLDPSTRHIDAEQGLTPSTPIEFIVHRSWSDTYIPREDPYPQDPGRGAMIACVVLTGRARYRGITRPLDEIQDISGSLASGDTLVDEELELGPGDLLLAETLSSRSAAGRLATKSQFTKLGGPSLPLTYATALYPTHRAAAKLHSRRNTD